jgi:hypothetical protein
MSTISDKITDKVSGIAKLCVTSCPLWLKKRKISALVAKEKK